jgi:hypothetical protein
MNHKPLAVALLVPLLASACAITGEDMRAKAREAYTVPADTPELTLQADLDRCQKNATDASRGLGTAGTAVMVVGVLVWPLIPVGLVLALSGAARGETAKEACMSTAGYLKK